MEKNKERIETLKNILSQNAKKMIEIKKSRKYKKHKEWKELVLERKNYAKELFDLMKGEENEKE